MECNVIKDLIPLYVDGCCSEESGKLVEAHIKSCADCQGECDNMRKLQKTVQAKIPAKKLSRVSEWKASLLQSILLYVSFALIALGVALEAATPAGLANGLWAFALVVPATANLLSLVNWYFVRMYKTKRSFSNCSCLITLLFTIAGYTWALLHYDFTVIMYSPKVVVGIVLSLIFIVLSKVQSNQYALLLGRE